MARNVLVCGLDIGSHTIRAVVAQKRKGSERLSLVGVGEAPSAGMRKGVVVDADEATAAVREAVKAAEQASGYRMRSAYVAVSGSHISSRWARGVVSVSRADQEVSRDDIGRVIAQAQSLGAAQNKEIIHVLPKEYVVDGEGGVHDPLGMRGLRLEANALVVEGSAPAVKSVLKCVEEAGVNADGLVVASLAASHAVLSKRQKELGVLLLDIGGTTSGLAAFEEGSMVHAAVLPVGSAHVTNDIAIGLQTDVDIAEMIKVRYGVCKPESVNKKEMISVAVGEGGEKIDNVSRREVAEIIEARMEEVFDLVDKELKKIARQALYPAGVIVVGGGAHMAGVGEFAKRRLRLPAHIGIPEHVDGVVDQLAAPQYATAVGLCLVGLDAEEKGERGGAFLSLLPGASGEWLRRWFRIFLP